jgi:hypothetical protein
MIGNGTERDNPRKVLADWKDKRVTIVGVLDYLFETKNTRRPFLIGVFQDVELELPTRARHYLGHLYLQHAETLKGCPLGSRVRCSCGVKPYVKQPKDGLGKPYQDWGLTYPNDIEVLPGPVFLPTAQEPPPARVTAANGPPPAPAPPPACDPYDAIIRVREGVEKAGGVAAVTALLDAVAGVGGPDAAALVMGLAGGVGGCEKLKRLLDILKL